MALDFRIVTYKEYSSTGVVIEEGVFDSLREYAKQFKLPLLLRLKDCYGIGGNVHYMPHELDALLSELLIVEREIFDSEFLNIIIELRSLVHMAQKDFNSIESLAD